LEVNNIIEEPLSKIAGVLNMQSGYIVKWSNIQQFDEYSKLENFIPFLQLLKIFNHEDYPDLLNNLLELFAALMEFQEL
jgi:hypothetical protein